MRRILLFLSALFIGLSSMYAQSSNEPIVIDEAFIGHKYYHGDCEVRNVSKMKAIVAKDKLALEEVKKAVVPECLAYVFACSGGCIMGWQIGGAPFGQFNPYVFAGGLGVAAIGIGFSALVDKHIMKGATIYNENLSATSFSAPVKFDFGLVPGGVGVTLSF